MNDVQFIATMMASPSYVAQAEGAGISKAMFNSPVMYQAFAVMREQPRSEPWSEDELSAIIGEPVIVDEAPIPSPAWATTRFIELNQKRAFIRVLDSAKARLQSGKSVEEVYRFIDGEGRLGDVSYKVNELHEFFTAMADELHSGGSIMSLGMPGLDELQAGLHRGDVTIISARTGVGKTALALQSISNLADAGLSVGIVSLEMSGQAMLKRVLMSRLCLSKRGLKDNFASVIDEANKLKDTSIRVVSVPGRTSKAIYNAVSSEHRKKTFDVVFIDHINRVKTLSKDRTSGLREAISDFKDIAVNLDVGVAVLSQINRQGASSANTENIKGSGAIEEDASTIIIIDGKPPENNGAAYYTLKVTKNREGPVGKVKVLWRPMYQRFQSDS